MGTKASNLQVSTHFLVGFRNWYSWHYSYFLLHLVMMTYVWICEKKLHVRWFLILRRSMLLQDFINEKSLPIFLTKKKLYLLRFSKKHRKITVILKFLKGCYFLLVCRRNVNFGLFCEGKLQFLKGVVWLIFLKQCESYNLNVKSSWKLNGPWEMYGLLRAPIFMAYLKACRGFLKWPWLTSWYLQFRRYCTIS